MTSPKLSWEDAVRSCMANPATAELAKSAYFLPPVEAGKRFHASAEFAEVRRLLPPNPGRALDLGAGNGILSYALACEGWDVTAVEPDPSELIGAGAIRQLSATSGVPITVIEAFGESIPLAAAGFDLVVARQVLHHANDLDGFCGEMARLSRPGALILTLRDHVISGPEQLDVFLENHPLHNLYGGENAFTLNQYRQALTRAGLTIRREWKSFQSVLNFDPATPEHIVDLLSNRFGPLRGIARAVAARLPFSAVGNALSLVDRRPGRLVSYLAEKPNR